MTKLTFTAGTLQKLGPSTTPNDQLYTLTLTHNGRVVYKATIESIDACEYLMKYDSIKLI